jgi:uncharacterized protein (DUF924 family)
MILPTDEILQFWFGDEDDDLKIAETQNPLWWGKNSALDTEIKSRFEPLLNFELAGEFIDYTQPHELLARIIMCDQFPRNMYRNLAQAFTYDEHARELAHQLIDNGNDSELCFIESAFAYLPFEHSEDLNDQHLSVHLYSSLLMEAPEDCKKLFSQHLEFAIRHREIIYDFGRFPHRNSVLGRQSTAEELAFLKTPHSSF